MKALKTLAVLCLLAGIILLIHSVIYVDAGNTIDYLARLAIATILAAMGLGFKMLCKYLQWKQQWKPSAY